MSTKYEAGVKLNENTDNNCKKENKSGKNFKLEINTIKEETGKKKIIETETYSNTADLLKENKENETVNPSNTKEDKPKTEVNENPNIIFYTPNDNENKQKYEDKKSNIKEKNINTYISNTFYIPTSGIAHEVRLTRKITVDIYISIKEEKEKENQKQKQKEKPIFSVSIDDMIDEDIENMNQDTRDKTDEDTKEEEEKKNESDKPKFLIPIKAIQTEKEKKIKIQREKLLKEKNKMINNKNIENLKRDLNSNTNTITNNGLFFNFNNNTPPLTNNMAGMNNNNIYNIINSNNIGVYNKRLAQLNEQKKLFLQLKEIGISALTNIQNINHYLLNQFVNNNLNINNVYNTNQCFPFNNNINNMNNMNNMNYMNNMNNMNNMNYFNNINYLGNPLLRNYFPNQNFMNNNMSNIYTMNNLNNYKNYNMLNNINNINNINNLNNQNYTITFKSKTKDPTIEKVSKIKVTTYLKDNSKKVENNEVVKKEKRPKNIIDLDSILSGEETRTVVRLNPIPPNYSSFDVCKLLDKYLQIESGKNQRIYKALYTPLCKIIGKNLGYCFVMMVKPKYVIDFYNTFYGKSFGKKKCKKPCNVIWADKQGEEFLKATEDDPIRKPIIFKDIKTD